MFFDFFYLTFTLLNVCNWSVWVPQLRRVRVCILRGDYKKKDASRLYGCTGRGRGVERFRRPSVDSCLRRQVNGRGVWLCSELPL